MAFGIFASVAEFERGRLRERTLLGLDRAKAQGKRLSRLRANGAELVGEVAQYQDKYRLCYMRGPAGIIVALAEELF